MRRTSLRRTIFVLTAVLALGISTAYAENDVEPVPAEQQVFLGIGCQGEGATCDSVDYWLGLEPGTSGVGNAFTITPLNHLFYLLEDDWSYADFIQDSSLDNYVLRTDEPVTGQITMRGYEGSDTSVLAGIEVELSVVRMDTNRRVRFPAVEVEEVLLTPGASTLEFEVEVPEALEGVETRGWSLSLSTRGIHVGTSGFVDGEGASHLTIPHWTEDVGFVIE